jgi:nucleoside-diphosphate-sugar epimerase
VTSALIGHTGFVGGTILRSHAFDACFRSTDIDTIRGREFDLVVCCGAPAEKWRANRDPEADRAGLSWLTTALAEVTARRLVLISTVDVYPVPHQVDELTAIDPEAGQPYGRHRFALEEFCRGRFDTTVLRLPGLYGRGLKKNALFDLLHDRPVDAVPGNARFQFYDVERIWSDVNLILDSSIALANITAEPVMMAEVAAQVFERELPLAWSDNAPSYDVHSVHADLVGGRDGYWFDASAVIDGIRAFVAAERAQ